MKHFIVPLTCLVLLVPIGGDPNAMHGPLWKDWACRIFPSLCL